MVGEAGVTLQAFDSWDEVQAHQESGSGSADAGTTGRAPGGFGGSLLSCAGFDDPLPEEMLDAFEGRDGADGGSGDRVGRWPDAGGVGDDGGGDQR